MPRRCNTAGNLPNTDPMTDTTLPAVIRYRAPGRPPISRDAILDAIRPRRPGWPHTVVRRSVVARAVGCSRATVGRAIADLERAGELYRVARRGPHGLQVRLAPWQTTPPGPWVIAVVQDVDYTREEGGTTLRPTAPNSVAEGPDEPGSMHVQRAPDGSQRARTGTGHDAGRS